jgi:hypothetical protein
MDEKTEQLRDIFLDVADEETVTESQQAGRGSLTTDESSVDERLLSVVEQVGEKFGLTTALDDEAYCRLVRSFYAGQTDEEIAEQLDREPDVVFHARMDLHLLRDEDWPDDEATATIRERLAGDDGETAIDRDAAALVDISALADTLDRDEQTVERAVAVVAASNRSRRVSHRFRTAFEEVLTDADLTVQFAADARDDGLDEATEGAEVDVDF